MTSTRRYRCKYCGALLPAWLPAAKEPNGALLLGHLSQQHPDRVGAYTARMHRDTDITPVALEAYAVVEDQDEAPGSPGDPASPPRGGTISAGAVP